MASDVRSVLWHGIDPFSTELCHLARRDRGWDVQGVVLADLTDGGTEVRYLLRVDELWRSRRLRVEMSGAHSGTLDLMSDGHGAWTVDGEAATALDGCIDMDLGISPSTNTLPIRRMDPPYERPVAIHAAWVRFPELTVEADAQSYERMPANRWRFRAGDFEADLEVDDDGLVVRYGDLWARIVASADGA